jgi:hypothetical protein
VTAIVETTRAEKPQDQSRGRHVRASPQSRLRLRLRPLRRWLPYRLQVVLALFCLLSLPLLWSLSHMLVLPPMLLLVQPTEPVAPG